MADLTNITVLKQILEKNGFTFSKQFGQNFIINPTICPRIAENCGDYVLEIGAGAGVLTKELCKVAKKVVSLEVDTRLLPVLDETLSEFDNVKIINADVLKTDLKKLIADEFGDNRICVAANLPYYITSPIIMTLLEQGLPIDSITVMVQKEAADRLCAELATREVGAVTVAVRYYSEPKKLFDVLKGNFFPAPKVDSAVIRMDLKENTALSGEEQRKFFKVVRAAFCQRRKTLLNSLSSGLNISKADAGDLLAATEIAPTARAEQLTMDDFLRLAREWK